MKRWLVKSLIVLAAMAGIAGAVLLLLCWQYCIWSWEDWQIYKCMSHECHPVWRDLHAGRIKPGDDIEGVIWRTHPPRVEKFENVVMLSYPPAGFTVVSILAKDGRVVSAGAGSCTWSKTFFGHTDDEEWQAFSRRYSAHLDAKWRARQAGEFIAEGRLPLILVIP